MTSIVHLIATCEATLDNGEDLSPDERLSELCLLLPQLRVLGHERRHELVSKRVIVHFITYWLSTTLIIRSFTFALHIVLFPYNLWRYRLLILPLNQLFCILYNQVIVIDISTMLLIYHH